MRIFTYKKYNKKTTAVSFIRTITVGPGVTPSQRRCKTPSVAGFTASGDFHPALKQTVIRLYTPFAYFAICNYKDIYIFLETGKNL